MTKLAPMPMRLMAIRFVAKDIHAFELAFPDSTTLPAAPPGAHIGVILPNGLARQYSLLHAGDQLDRYEIGVKRDFNGSGSQFMHDSLKVGALLAIELPRNNFPLVEGARSSIFFAGGIGVTPIVAMLEHLAVIGRPGTLFYAGRHRDEMAFIPELSRVCKPVLHVDSEHEGRVFDIAAAVAASPRDAHLYCCGPASMLAAFEAATRDWPQDQVHVEYFTPREAAALNGGYIIALADSGREFQVPPGRSILQVLRDAGMTVPSSCEEGVCGACETAVIEGLPDHRDSILSPAERASNRTMMICCSGSKTPRLVLNI
jgi:tetrachlorobenzoquinone reductase